MRPTSKLIAVVDDDPAVREVVASHLKRAGFQTAEFANAGSFYEFLDARKPDLVILDRALPDGDGLDVCRYMRERHRFAGVPVLMLTGMNEELDRVLGLELGADDYIAKPFSSLELVARVKTHLRRLDRESEAEKIELGDLLVIDLGRYRVTTEGHVVELTPTEFRVLRILAEKPGWVLSREQILDALWGNDKAVIDRTVDLHITNIRKKLGPAGKLIQSVRGVGYRIVEPSQSD